MRINLARALNLGADDPMGWRKALTFVAVMIVCSLTSMLILPAIFMLLYMPGYFAQMVRNVAMGDEHGKLPEPINAGGLIHGLMLAVISVVYSLPLVGMLVVGLGMGAVALGTAAKHSSAVLGMGSLAGFGLFSIVGLFMFFLICALMPMVTLQYVSRCQFNDAFNFGAITAGMFKSPLDYAVVVFVPMIMHGVVAVIPIVNLFAWPLVTLVSAHLIGQYGATVLGMYENSPEPNDVGFDRF